MPLHLLQQLVYALASLIKKPFPFFGKTINNINYHSQVELQAKLENDTFEPSLGVFSLIYCCTHALTVLVVLVGFLLHLGNR
jgi:hypothetical protein